MNLIYVYKKTPKLWYLYIDINYRFYNIVIIILVNFLL